MDPVQSGLERLSELRTVNDPSVVATELRKALRDRSNLVVAKAAKIAGEMSVKDVVPELVAAFERLMVNPAKLDKRCAATHEIATALYALDYTEPEVYLRGIRHVQKEASFGPPVDEAARLRAQCGMGLARTAYPEVMSALADLLCDKEPQARVGAIRALATNGGEAGWLLLRVKALTGDDDPEVMAECFAGLLAADFARSLPFVAKFMDDERDAVAESAILSIGAQRRIEAFEVLREKWDRSVYSDARKTLISALGMLRVDEATEFLLELLESASVATAEEIVRVLVTYHGENRVMERLKKIVESRGSEELSAMVRGIGEERDKG